MLDGDDDNDWNNDDDDDNCVIFDAIIYTEKKVRKTNLPP